jgi:cyclic dehypoxanthinyl futalosine synthase
MRLSQLYSKALREEDLTLEEALFLYERAPLSELMALGFELRKKHKGEAKYVGWIIDRNVNITNICVAGCKFCNFSRKPGDPEGYVTTMDEYRRKIKELFALGGDQLLLQGGLHPKLRLDFYQNLFRQLKQEFPSLKLHALGPAEVVYLAKREKLSYEQVLRRLMEAGLDSLTGAGAEILVDRVRRIVSPGKCTAEQWLEVMRVAHKLNLPTSATMMFGMIETKQERMIHLLRIRDLQKQKPEGSYGFVTFVPWTFQSENTELIRMYPDIREVTADEYIRMIAISRIVLNNIDNIQTSWLTVGKEVAQITLYAGANDFGSIMIEENVVSAAGAQYSMNAQQIQQAIREAGFIPRRRNQKYEFID